MESRKSQRGGDDSTNIQADAIHFGISYSDAREIALDVFRANFAEMSQQAMSEASRRAEILTEHYLRRVLESQKPIPEVLTNQDRQHELLLAQQDFASASGTEDMAALLSGMLVRKSQMVDGDSTSVNLLLNQALRTVPQLNVAELEALGVLFYIHRWPHVHGPFDGRQPTVEQLRASLHLGLSAFSNLNESAGTLHLELLGCIFPVGSLQHIGFVLQSRYPYLFTTGISPRGFVGRYRRAYVLRESDARLVIPVALSDFEGYLESHGQAFLGAKQARQRNLRTRDLFNARLDIEEYVLGGSSHIAHVFGAWNSRIGRLRPTSLGTAIGHAYWQHLSGQSMPLGQFV